MQGVHNRLPRLPAPVTLMSMHIKNFSYPGGGTRRTDTNLHHSRCSNMAQVVLFIRDGLDTKNNKTRVVCAEEIGSIIDQEGPTVYRVNRQVWEV